MYYLKQFWSKGHRLFFNREDSDSKPLICFKNISYVITVNIIIMYFYVTKLKLKALWTPKSYPNSISKIIIRL